MGGLMGNNNDANQRRYKSVPTNHAMQIKDSNDADTEPSVYELNSIFKSTGALVVLNVGLSALCLIIMLVSYIRNETEFRNEWDAMFLAASTISLIFSIAIIYVFILRRLFGLTKTINAIFAVLCFISIILLAVGSAGTAANVNRDERESDCHIIPWGEKRRICYKFWNGDIAAGAAGVGFLTVITLILQAAFHIRDSNNNTFAAPVHT